MTCLHSCRHPATCCCLFKETTLTTPFFLLHYLLYWIIPVSIHAVIFLILKKSSLNLISTSATPISLLSFIEKRKTLRKYVPRCCLQYLFSFWKRLPIPAFCLFVFCPPSFQDASLLILFLTSLVTPSQSPLLDLISQTSKHGCSTGLSLWMFLFIITTLVISYYQMTLNMVNNLDDFQIYISSPDFSFKLPVFLQNMSIQMSNRNLQPCSACVFSFLVLSPLFQIRATPSFYIFLSTFRPKMYILHFSTKLYIFLRLGLKCREKQNKLYLILFPLSHFKFNLTCKSFFLYHQDLSRI